MDAKRKLGLLEIYWASMNSLSAFFNFFGLEMRFYNPSTSEKALLKYLLKKYNIDLLLDVGAAKGQYGKKVIGAGYKGTLYSFEPIPDSYSRLLAASKSHSNWKTFNMGLGEKTETVTMNISLNSDSSSILDMHETHSKNADVARFYRKETIQIDTLDNFHSKESITSKNIYLKLDVQGYEKHLLAGARKTLTNVKVIQTELSLTELYKGGTLIEEMIDLLRNSGFELYSIMPGFKSKETGQLFQVDGFFINKNLLG